MSASSPNQSPNRLIGHRRRSRDQRDMLGTATSGLEAKVVVMGNAGVGKTSLVQRYTTNTFNTTKIVATAGAGFHTKRTSINGVTVRLQLWDTAGQERFRSLAPMYYRGSNAAIVVYDITNPASFEDVKEWLEELKKNITPGTENDMIIYIVGAKLDLAQQRRVTRQQVRAALTSWFPPPKPPTPPPVVSYQGYPFSGGSTIYPSSNFIPGPISALSTSVSTHLPSLPSWNLNLNYMRPRFTSLTTSGSKSAFKTERTGESPTGTDSTGGATSSTAVTTTTSASGFLPTPTASTSRLAFPKSSTTSAVPGMANLGLNVNMTGSQYSGFRSNGEATGNGVHPFPTTTSASGLVEFPGLPPTLNRRNTADGPRSSALKSSRSMGGVGRTMSNAARPRLKSCMSDDEEGERGRERQPISFRRFKEMEDAELRETSSAEDEETATATKFSAHVRDGHAKSRREREREEALRKRRDEERAHFEIDCDENDDVNTPLALYGFSKEVEVREVSAKDNKGVESLFETLLQAIFKRREAIEREKQLRERDSVMLNVPTWGALPEEEDDTTIRYSMFGSCCRT